MFWGDEIFVLGDNYHWVRYVTVHNIILDHGSGDKSNAADALGSK